MAGDAAAAFVKNKANRGGGRNGHFDAEKSRQEKINHGLLTSDGGENTFALHRELGDLMQTHVFVERTNEGLDIAMDELGQLKERSQQIALDDRGTYTNQSLSWARQVQDMIVMAEVITKGARLRDECRGSHYKAEFELKIPEGKFPGDPEFEDYKAKWKANNEKWLKATIAVHTDAGPEISYAPVNVSVLPPTKPRDYR